MKYGAHWYLFTRSWSDADLPYLDLDLARLIALAGHANIKATFGTYHAVTEVRDCAAGLRALGPRLALVHACENDRGIFQDLCPDGRAFVEKGMTFLRALEARFSGAISRRP